jgi:hypothetical protein
MATNKKNKAAKIPKRPQIFTDEELRDLKVLRKWTIAECVSFIFGERFLAPEEWEDKSIVKRFVRILVDEFDVRENYSSYMTIPRGEFISFVRSAKIKEWFIGNSVRATSEVRKIFMEIGDLDLREKENLFLKMKKDKEFAERAEKVYAIKRKILEESKAHHDTARREAMGLLDDSQIDGKSVNRGGRPGIDNELFNVSPKWTKRVKKLRGTFC